MNSVEELWVQHSEYLSEPTYQYLTMFYTVEMLEHLLTQLPKDNEGKVTMREADIIEYLEQLVENPTQFNVESINNTTIIQPPTVSSTTSCIARCIFVSLGFILCMCISCLIYSINLTYCAICSIIFTITYSLLEIKANIDSTKGGQ